MKSRSVRLVTEIAKRTTTTTTATNKAAAAEQINYQYNQCPHAVSQNENILSNSSATIETPTPFTYENVRPYSEVPGPKPLPILGNTWRLVFQLLSILMLEINSSLGFTMM